MDDFPDRQSIRLKGYDYSQNGLYFVTIGTHNRENMFGEIINGKMVLNENGKIVESVWNSLPKHHNVQLDCFQIMPNHIHAIIILCRGFACKTRMVYKTHEICGSGIARNAPTNKPTFQNVTAGSLPCIIRSFKSEITKQIHRMVRVVRTQPQQIFQRNYFERIIRNEPEYDKICWYILHNPEIAPVDPD